MAPGANTATRTKARTTSGAKATPKKPVARTESAGGISDEAVERATGCNWDKWFRMLDVKGAAKLDHKGIVALVEPHLPRSGWWAQMVTVSYEQARGLRERHQTPAGWSAGASKTVAVPVSRLFKVFHDAALRRRWLADPMAIRKATPSKSLRVTWSDGTNVDINFFPKGAAKSVVQIEHSKLTGAKAVAEKKAYWRAALERMAGVVAR